MQKLVELFAMSEPKIKTLTRPIYAEENTQFGEINLDEYRFDFGIFFTSEYDGKIITIPESIGRIVYQFESTQ